MAFQINLNVAYAGTNIFRSDCSAQYEKAEGSN